MTDDSFPRWSTETLIGIAYRVTPRYERDEWVATSSIAREYTSEKLREFVIEQLECMGITESDVNHMKS